MQRKYRHLNCLFQTFIAVVFAFCAKGQYDNNWYFGRRAGLNFSVTGPQVLTNSAMISAEAAAAISDDDGNLLFYSSGVDVYDRNHQLMLNGDNLGGNISACQMSIVPHPGNPDLFYIFTADAIEDDFVNGYRYSVVDMSQNGGNGKVTSKNNLLWSSCTERLATVRHSNGVYVWLITNDHESNVFRAWLIDCNGLQLNPVVSTLGPTMDQHVLMNVGVLKASPDGRMLCQTHFPVGGSPSNFFQIFDFDNSTGVLSNARSISLPNTRYNHCEFSPDSKLLYLTRKDDMQLDQLEVTLPTVAAIQSSRISFPTQVSYYDIQMAVNEKIYLTQSNQLLAVINQPNQKGAACDFQRNVIDLQPGTAFIGLPSHINDIVGNRFNGFDYTIIDRCTGQVQFNASTTLPPVISWQWDFGDGNTSTQQNPVHTFSNPSQVYKVKLTITSLSFCGKVTRTRQVFPSGFADQTPDFEFANVCDSGYYRFTNKSSSLQVPGITYLWDFGDGNTSTDVHPKHTYASTGPYDVKLKILTGSPCFDDSLTIRVDVQTFTINTIPDQIINFGESVMLTTTGPIASYVWDPPSWLNNSAAQSPVAKPRETILYKVTATDANNCRSEDSVKITVKLPDDVNDIYVPGAFTPNNDGRNDVMRPFMPRAYTLLEFSVYNRWGQRIFTTSLKDEGWNGKINDVLRDSGTFVWVVKALDPRTGKQHNRKGTFIIIR
ncbi:MAG: PKD domain-containing protein [Bacteroidetes bacterium]|nr:PKD domain-containing protein [Bacteroidota bacterium]